MNVIDLVAMNGMTASEVDENQAAAARFVTSKFVMQPTTKNSGKTKQMTIWWMGILFSKRVSKLHTPCT